MLFCEAPLGFLEPIGPVARNRPRLRRTLVVEAALGVTQPAAPTVGRGHLRRQLIPARVTKA